MMKRPPIRLYFIAAVSFGTAACASTGVGELNRNSLTQANRQLSFADAREQSKRKTVPTVRAIVDRQKTPASSLRNSSSQLPAPATTAQQLRNVPAVGTARTTIRVFFSFDAAQTIIGVLADYVPSGTDVLITGHTDSVGSAQYNERLGMRRAQFVADRLNKAGVAAERMKLASRGESEPIASNDSTVGRAKNRRVDIQFLR